MEETILIECSRQSSIEGATRNFTELAEWTCNTGDGVVLDIGDKIQLHSGFVSEKGAQAGEIEIKERDRKETYIAEVSKDIVYGIKQTPVPEESYQEYNQENIYPYAVEIGGNESRTFQIKDGETNIIYSPYKTTNGEFYASLPRRHIGWNTAIKAVSKTTDIWESFDCQKGASVGRNLGAGCVGNVIYTLAGGDQRTVAPNWVYPEFPWQYPPEDYKVVGENLENWIAPLATIRVERKGMIRNDCSRYTIFRLDQVFRTEAAASASGTGPYDGLGGAAGVTSSAIGTALYQNCVDLRDPAILGNWSQVKEVMTLTSKAGFNTPVDVADEITEQMNKRGTEVTRNAYAGNIGDTQNTTFYQKQLGYFSSPAIKPYNCASSVWDVNGWDSYRQVKDPTSLDTDASHFYMSMYQHIGVKRPELWVQGRATNASMGFLKPSVGDGSNTPTAAQCLNLGMEWTQDNLELLNALFVVQGKYPELFDTEITQMGLPGLTPGDIQHPLQGVDKHRFIHFNGQDTATDSAAPTAYNHFPTTSLGYDLYGPKEGEALPANYAYAEWMATFPLFFDYNTETVGLRHNDVGYTSDALGGVSDINDLAYGWARKMRIPGASSASGLDKFYIGLQFTRTGNRIPEYLFNGQSHIAKVGIGSGRRWGFDWHFSAYGSACINLYSGVIDNARLGQNVEERVGLGVDCGDNFNLLNYEDSWHEATAIAIAGTIADYNVGPYYRELLLGADGPKLAYDSSQSRFSFKNLHIAERQSNIYNAGQVASAPATAVPANPSASEICYKINKASLGNSYCPNMAPYKRLIIEADRTMPEQQMLSNNYEAWQPYDATCGLFIEEIAVPENTWDENLIGVLGFYYSQFNNTDTTRQVTINNRKDSSNLASLTTQAPINAGDVIEWTKNGFGNSNYSLTLPMTYTRRFTSLPAGAALSYRNIFPPATLLFAPGEDSTKITAIDLPTKTARPYYTIRSDIVPRNSFIGGNQDLVRPLGAVNRPVIGVVNKVNGYGDFYSLDNAGNQTVFTNTEKRVITSIKTTVCDPDGSYAKVDKSSSVIYQITKTRNIDMTPVDTLLESKKKADQLAGQQAESMLKDMRDAKVSYSQTFL